MTTLTVGEFYYDGYQSFARGMQLNLPGCGIKPTSRLYRVIGAVYDDRRRGRVFTDDEEAAIAALRDDAEFGGWEEFAQFLFTHKLVAARSAGFVPHRPRDLGERPHWIGPVDKARPQRAGQAIRHIVPSHLLGFGAEKTASDIKASFPDLIESYMAAYARWRPADRTDVIDLFRAARPKMTRTPPSDLAARQLAWALMYNHPGNLWVGNAEDNQTIGFMYATVYGLLHNLKKALKDSPTGASGSFTAAVSSALNSLDGFDTGALRTDIIEVLDGALEDTKASLEKEDKDEEEDEEEEEGAAGPETRLVSFVEDVAANLQLDIPRLNDWDLVQDWRGKFMQQGMTAGQMCEFLDTDFRGSLAKPSY